MIGRYIHQIYPKSYYACICNIYKPVRVTAERDYPPSTIMRSCEEEYINKTTATSKKCSSGTALLIVRGYILYSIINCVRRKIYETLDDDNNWRIALISVS